MIITIIPILKTIDNDKNIFIVPTKMPISMFIIPYY